MLQGAAGGYHFKEGVAAVKGCFLGSTSSMRFLKKTMTHYAKEMEKDDWHFEGKITSAMAAMISGVAARRCRVSWFVRQEQTKAPLDDRALRDAAWNFCRSARGPWRWTKREYVPRFGGHLLFWLHFCSGERRCEDVQAYLEKLDPQVGYVLRILSVDIIYPSQPGSMASTYRPRLRVGLHSEPSV